MVVIDSSKEPNVMRTVRMASNVKHSFGLGFPIVMVSKEDGALLTEGIRSSTEGIRMSIIHQKSWQTVQIQHQLSRMRLRSKLPALLYQADIVRAGFANRFGESYSAPILAQKGYQQLEIRPGCAACSTSDTGYFNTTSTGLPPFNLTDFSAECLRWAQGLLKLSSAHLAEGDSVLRDNDAGVADESAAFECAVTHYIQALHMVPMLLNTTASVGLLKFQAREKRVQAGVLQSHPKDHTKEGSSVNSVNIIVHINDSPTTVTVFVGSAASTAYPSIIPSAAVTSAARVCAMELQVTEIMTCTVRLSAAAYMQRQLSDVSVYPTPPATEEAVSLMTPTPVPALVPAPVPPWSAELFGELQQQAVHYKKVEWGAYKRIVVSG